MWLKKKLSNTFYKSFNDRGNEVNKNKTQTLLTYIAQLLEL